MAESQGDQIRRIFTFGSFVKITEIDQSFGPLFSTLKVINYYFVVKQLDSIEFYEMNLC
jgi:hypothetical protein